MTPENCPFCGGTAIISKKHNEFGNWWIVSCSKCLASQFGGYQLKEQAVEAWNKRAEKWINVEKATPKHAAWVMVYTTDNEYHCVEYDEELNNFHSYHQDLATETITHWCYIEPPKGD